MMTIEQIKESVVNSIKQFLGDKYPELKVGFEIVNDKTLVPGEYLTVADQRVMGVWIPIEEIAEKYQNSEDVDAYLKEQLEVFLWDYEVMKDSYEFFDRVSDDFALAQEYLVPYVFDANASASLLENHPYQRIGDIALECHLSYENENGAIQSSINNNMIQKWNVTEENLMEFMFRKHQEQVYLIGANDLEYCIENDKEPVNLLKAGIKEGNETEYILGCSSLRDFEAAFIFNPAAMKKVADVLEDDFYIVAVCTDNVIIVPAKYWNVNMEEFRENTHRIIKELTEADNERNVLPEQLMMYIRKIGEVMVVTE